MVGGGRIARQGCGYDAFDQPDHDQAEHYMSEAAGRKLPEEVVEKTKQHILDTLAAMISGSELPPGRFAIQFARALGGRTIATVAGSNVVCGPIEAALANGCWRIPMRPTTRIPLAIASRAARSCPRRWPPEKDSASTARTFCAR